MENYILENGKKFFLHPTYKKYSANKYGEIINVRLRKPMRGNICLTFGIYISKNNQRTYLSHRFIFECFYGLIEKK